MPTLDERVAYLEGRLEEHSGSVNALRSDVQDVRHNLALLDQKVDRLFAELSRRIEASIERADVRSDRLESRMDGFDTKLSRQFTWLVGIQILMFIAIMSALATR